MIVDALSSRALRVAVAALAIGLPIAGAHAQAKRATVEVHGAGGQIRIVSDSDLTVIGRQDVPAEAHNVKGTFNGVCLYDVLRLVGAPPSDSLRGQALATYVLVEAADGYRVIFSIAELSSRYAQHEVMLVDRVGGKPLDTRDGPFRIIAPDDKAPARWARQVVRITIVTLPLETKPPTR